MRQVFGCQSPLAGLGNGLLYPGRSEDPQCDLVLSHLHMSVDALGGEEVWERLLQVVSDSVTQWVPVMINLKEVVVEGEIQRVVQVILG